MGLWVNKRVTVDNFRKVTLFNVFLDDKFKVILVDVGGSRNPMDSLTFPYLAENRLKYGGNGTVVIFNYWGKIKIDRNFYDGRNFCQNFWGGSSAHR